MGSLNRCTIIGNMGKDPEVKFTAGGTSVCNFSVACSEKHGKDKEQKEHTEWFRVVVFGKTGEACGQHLQKGQQVYVEGRLQTREWNDKEGNKRTTTELIANNVVFLGSKGDRWAPPASTPVSDPSDDGVPF